MLGDDVDALQRDRLLLELLGKGADVLDELLGVRRIGGGIGLVELDHALAELPADRPDAVRVTLDMRVATRMQMLLRLARARLFRVMVVIERLDEIGGEEPSRLSLGELRVLYPVQGCRQLFVLEPAAGADQQVGRLERRQQFRRDGDVVRIDERRDCREYLNRGAADFLCQRLPLGKACKHLELGSRRLWRGRGQRQTDRTK